MKTKFELTKDGHLSGTFTQVEDNSTLKKGELATFVIPGGNYDLSKTDQLIFDGTNWTGAKLINISDEQQLIMQQATDITSLKQLAMQQATELAELKKGSAE